MNWDKKEPVVSMTVKRWKMFLILSCMTGVMLGVIATTLVLC